MVAERQQRHGLVGIGRRVAVLVHGGIRRQRLAFALQLLHAAHRDHGGCPVDHDRKAHCLGRREAPGMRVGAQRGKHALERHHLRERRGAVGVGDVALLRSLHHVAAAPEIVEGVVDRDRAAAVGVGQLHAGVDRLPGHRLAELLLGVPGLRGFEPAREPPNRSLRHAAAGLRPKQLVEVQGLDGVMGADAMPRGRGGEFRGVLRLGRVESAVEVGGADDRLVGLDGNDMEGFGHRFTRPS